jgi:hypothetical protein
MPQSIYPWGKSPWYPLDRRLVGPRASPDAVVKKKFPVPARNQTPIIQPVAWLLSWLLSSHIFVIMLPWMNAPGNALNTAWTIRFCDISSILVVVHSGMVWSCTITPPYIFMVWCLTKQKLCLHVVVLG